MFKKNIAIIIAIIVVVGLGYWIYQSTLIPEEEGKEETKDEVSILLEDLKQETKINFSEIQPVEIKWNVNKYEEIEEVIVEGKGFEAKGISSEQYNNVELFFEDKGFEVDLYNVADATFAWLVGYKKDYIVCTIVGKIWLDEEGMPLEGDKNDVEVKCGKGDSSIEHLFSKEELIKKLFAEKYNKKVAQVNLSINQETENHVRGGIAFLPGGPGEEGIFLAAKVDDHWELAFDGTGVISCEQVEKYNFPEDMIENCSKTQTIETKNGDEFSITLEANPTTGYQWELEFESDFVQLVERKYTPLSPEKVGSGGHETFNLLALKSGKTEIVFSYLRSWEDKPPIESRFYEIIIE
ncbi:protease inhibitor I42 family protein [Patescibacteria group bacterium]|nr:protease inhibitor I42 family protein [Patescibacteria group bacterium]